MAWLSNNWIWIVLGAAFIGLHLFGHGGHTARLAKVRLRRSGRVKRARTAIRRAETPLPDMVGMAADHLRPRFS